MPEAKEQTITFIGVQILSFTRTRKLTNIKLACELSTPVMKKMEWTEAPACYTGGGLEGDITASGVKLQPSERALAQEFIELDAATLKKFKTVRLEIEGTRGVGHRTELRFDCITNDMKAGQKLEKYMVRAVDGKSQLRVSYTERDDAEQADLDLEHSTCDSCDDKIPLEPTNPKKHVNGSKCTASSKAPKQENLAMAEESAE